MILSDLQHTLGATASFEGVGLHTGNMPNCILPGAQHSYVFVRIDLDGSPEVAGCGDQ